MTFNGLRKVLINWVPHWLRRMVRASIHAYNARQARILALREPSLHWELSSQAAPFSDRSPANDLERYFAANTGRLLNKWSHYFSVYDRHFARYRGTDVHILEFGVSHGGSLQMWKDYFGPRAKIYGVDINPACQALEEDQVKIFIGDQSSRRFLRSLVASVPRVDILIDDGGHTMRQQVTTFEEMFAHVEADGVYLCEDIHTSYWKRFGGGYQRRGTFIEYAKRLIDRLNAWHSEQPHWLSVDDFTRSAASLHFYDSIFVVEKQPMPRPSHQQRGNPVPGIEPL